MKYIGVFIIKIYQSIFVPIIKSVLGISILCPKSPNCSAFTVSSIKKHGFIKGIFLGGKQIIACR